VRFIIFLFSCCFLLLLFKIGKEFSLRFASTSSSKSRFSFSSLFGGKSKSKKLDEGNDTPLDPTSTTNNNTSDSDNGSVSENASVNSERYYGNKIKNILLQADDAEV
jgi:hypothetical protein